MAQLLPITYGAGGNGTLIMERVMGLKNRWFSCLSTPNTKVPIMLVLGAAKSSSQPDANSS